MAFNITRIETEFKPGPTLMFVRYTSVPGYQDGSFTVVLTKWPHADIESVNVTPNPALIENPDGVAVVVDWVTDAAGRLRLTSTDGLDQDVTGLMQFPAKDTDPPLLVTRTTTFTLEADGLYGANLDNAATKAKDAVVTPRTDFSCAILSDSGKLQLTWDVLGAAQVEIDWLPGQQKLKGCMTLAPSAERPLPYKLKLSALDQDGKEIGSATLKRCWTVGSSAPVGGDAMWRLPVTGSIVVSSDGRRLCALSGEGTNCSIAVLDPTTLNLIKSIPAGSSAILLTFTCTSDQIYVTNQIYTANGGSACVLTVIDASYDVTAKIDLLSLASPPCYNLGPTVIAANDKYIFVKTAAGPVSLLVIDAHTHKEVWQEAARNSFRHTTGMALSSTRVYYTGDDAVKALDFGTFASVTAVNVSMPEFDFEQLVTTADDARVFLLQPLNVTTFQGPGLLNPTAVLPIASGYQEMVITTDAMQAFVRRTQETSSFIQLLEFDPTSGSYATEATLLEGSDFKVALAIAPDNARVFVGSLDANRSNASITAVVASYS